MHQLSILRRIRFATCGAVLGAGALTVALDAQTLPIDSTMMGASRIGVVDEFEFRAPSAGVLLVVVRAEEDGDLGIVVTDADGQELPDGRSDQDLGGVSGAEQDAFTIPREGVYFVRIVPITPEGGVFRIGASWLPFPELERPVDPDGALCSGVGSPAPGRCDVRASGVTRTNRIRASDSRGLAVR